jgi:hypothetical protein
MVVQVPSAILINTITDGARWPSKMGRCHSSPTGFSSCDWFTVFELGMDYALSLVRKDRNEIAKFPGDPNPLMVPVEGFTCKPCRFVRLRATEGVLDWDAAPDSFEELRRMFGG